MRRGSWLVGALSLAMLGTGCVVHARARAGVVVEDDRPPPERVEVAPAQRVGYVWVRGHWVRRERRWFWVGGHWQAENVGHMWVQGHWEQRGNRWMWIEGHWQ
jgi:hypothetical protein